MIFAAAGLVALAVVLVAWTSWTARRASSEWLEYLRSRDAEGRTEREVLYRAVLARNATEFGSLDRIRTVERNANARPAMTRDEYEQMLRNDMRGMGYEGDKIEPLVPEGL